jgi:carbon-monoxide dehydrogenase large subunit
MDQGIGRPVRRKEDFRLLTGRGAYTDDYNPAGQVHALILRSPHAHARVMRIDLAAARAAPGVLCAWSGADYEAHGFGPLPGGAVGADIIDPSKPGLIPRPGTEFFHATVFPLAMDKVRRVGEAVALIVAESLDQAKDAAELAEVDYEPLPQVTDAAEAVKPGAPQLWEGAPGNICLEVERGDQAATDAAFAGAAHCVVMELRNNRVAPITLEPRAQIVAYDPETDHYTVHAGSSRSFLHKKMLVRYLGVEDDQVHVISGDVGGSYGMRGGGYPENLLATWAAARLGRPVKWVCERSEGMISDAQARDLITHGELALDADGRFLALRIRHLYDCGTHGSNFAPLNNGVRLITSNYDIPTAHLVAKAVMTNTLPTGTYRGAPRRSSIWNA